MPVSSPKRGRRGNTTTVDVHDVIFPGVLAALGRHGGTSLYRMVNGGEVGIVPPKALGLTTSRNPGYLMFTPGNASR